MMNRHPTKLRYPWEYGQIVGKMKLGGDSTNLIDIFHLKEYFQRDVV